MTTKSQETLKKSVKFVRDIQGTDLEKMCARATAWGAGSHRIATGELFCEPSLDQAQWGKFWPDDETLLDTLKSSAKFVSFDDPLIPIEAHQICLGLDPHIHFSVSGPAVKHGDLKK